MFSFGLSSIRKQVRRFVGGIYGLLEPIEYVPASDSEKLDAVEEGKIARYRSKLNEHGKNEKKPVFAYRAS